MRIESQLNKSSVGRFADASEHLDRLLATEFKIGDIVTWETWRRRGFIGRKTHRIWTGKVIDVFDHGANGGLSLTVRRFSDNGKPSRYLEYLTSDKIKLVKSRRLDPPVSQTPDSGVTT